MAPDLSGLIELLWPGLNLLVSHRDGLTKRLTLILGQQMAAIIGSRIRLGL